MSQLFLAIGPDEFLLKEFLSGYKKAAIEKYDEFAVQTFSFIDHPLSEIKQDIFSPAFFGGKKIIFCEEFPPSASPKLSEKKKGEYEAFLSTLSKEGSVPEDTVLIFSNPNPDKRTKFFKGLKKIAEKTWEHAQFDPKKDGKKFQDWITARTTKYGSSISPKDADFLRAYSGNDLRTLDTELKKLSLLRTGTEITQSDITDLAVPGNESADFAFSNAIASGKGERVLKELKTLVEEYDIGMVFNRDVISSFRTLLKTFFAIKSPDEKSGIHPFVLRNMKGAASKFTEDQLLSFHQSLKNIDVMSKDGRLALSGDTRTFVMTLEKEIYGLYHA